MNDTNFQSQTPFMAAHGLAAHVGGWIVTIGMGKNCNSFSARFLAFY